MNILVFTNYSMYVLHTEEESELTLTKLTWEMALLSSPNQIWQQ